jgi:pantoate--beta-alanine ligase
MQICRTIGELRTARNALDGKVGFVPTMGALHAGHLELVRRAAVENHHVILSIFVNPTQFAAQADVDLYPKSVESDLEKARKEGVALVFLPDAPELYPDGFSTTIDAGQIARPLEGASRPGHFQGVATVVTKLLNICQPDTAYFGEKDRQQLLVIERVVEDLNLPVEIIGVPTVRDADGLAMSSRNALLTREQRAAAVCVPGALMAVQQAWQAGERHPDRLRDTMRAVIEAEPLARLDYVSIASPVTLAELHDTVSGAAIASLAAFFGNVRLIDNCRLDQDQSSPVKKR